MSMTALALLLYCAWSLSLLIAIAGMRVWITASSARAANSFSVSGDDVSAFSGRLCRAHANCYENLPIFGGIAVVAITSGLHHVTDSLALIFTAARIGQSVTHLISVSNRAVVVRFGFLSIQIAIQLWWLIQLLPKLTS